MSEEESSAGEDLSTPEEVTAEIEALAGLGPGSEPEPEPEPEGGEPEGRSPAAEPEPAEGADDDGPEEGDEPPKENRAWAKLRRSNRQLEERVEAGEHRLAIATRRLEQVLAAFAHQPQPEPELDPAELDDDPDRAILREEIRAGVAPLEERLEAREHREQEEALAEQEEALEDVGRLTQEFIEEDRVRAQGELEGFDDAAAFAMGALARAFQLQNPGTTADDARHYMESAYLPDQFLRYAASGESYADSLYAYAKELGWRPGAAAGATGGRGGGEPQASPSAEKIRKRVRDHARPAPVEAGGKSRLTAEQLLKMDDAEAGRVLARMTPKERDRILLSA